MSKKAHDFVQQVNKQNFSAAKGLFESAMAEKILAVFENKKIELASQMVGDSVVKEGRRKPDLQRDIGWWVVDDNKGDFWAGPFQKRVDAKREKQKAEREPRTLDTTLSVQFGTIDRLGKFLPESHMTEGTEIAEAKKHSHDFEVDPLDAFDAKLSRGDTVDLKGLEVDDMNTSSYKKFMEDQLGRAAKNVKAKVDRTGMASLSFEVVDPNKVKSVLQDDGIMESAQMTEGTQINEGAYDIPWTEDSWDRNINKWERKYKVTIKTRDDNATVSGKDSDIKKFLTKELDFEEQDLEMIGLD